jgi:hypothetical protein
MLSLLAQVSVTQVLLLDVAPPAWYRNRSWCHDAPPSLVGPFGEVGGFWRAACRRSKWKGLVVENHI